MGYEKLFKSCYNDIDKFLVMMIINKYNYEEIKTRLEQCDNMKFSDIIPDYVYELNTIKML